MKLEDLPEQLPERPEGYTQRMIAHLNFGGGKGASTYEICDPKKRVTPIVLTYSSHGGSGFSLPGVKPLMTWAQLRQSRAARRRTQVKVTAWFADGESEEVLSNLEAPITMVEAIKLAREKLGDRAADVHSWSFEAEIQ
jgi:hypothetical protein